jgi:hypothetical protein
MLTYTSIKSWDSHCSENVAFFDAVEELSKIMNNLSQLVSGSRFEPCTSRMRRSAKFLAATQNKQHCRWMECLYLRCEGSVRRAAADAVSTTGLPTRSRSASSYAAEQSHVYNRKSLNIVPFQHESANTLTIVTEPHAVTGLLLVWIPQWLLWNCFRSEWRVSRTELTGHN